MTVAVRVGMKLEKVWGTTEPLILTPMFELHRLIIKPWHRCSLHVHQFKHNSFYVMVGMLFVDFGEDYTIAVSEGGVTSTRPGVAHQFHTEEKSVECLEMYYTEPLSTDIRRFNIGGEYARPE